MPRRLVEDVTVLLADLLMHPRRIANGLFELRRLIEEDIIELTVGTEMCRLSPSNAQSLWNYLGDLLEDIARNTSG